MRTTLGFPCVHEMTKIVDDERVLVEEDVHVFWRQIKWFGEVLYGVDEPVDLDVNRVVVMDLVKTIMDGKLDGHQCRSVVSQWNAITSPEFVMIGKPEPEVKIDARGRPRKTKTGR